MWKYSIASPRVLSPYFHPPFLALTPECNTRLIILLVSARRLPFNTHTHTHVDVFLSLPYCILTVSSEILTYQYVRTMSNLYFIPVSVFHRLKDSFSSSPNSVEAGEDYISLSYGFLPFFCISFDTPPISIKGLTTD